jgi:transposase-like protein
MSKSLFEFLNSHPTEQKCIDYLEKILWNNKPISPFDPTSKVYKCANNRYKCKNTNKYFTVRTNTIFRNSKIPLQKWLWSLYLFSSHKKGISSCQLSKDIGITQKSAWSLLQRSRYTFKNPIFIKEMLKGSVEIDETYVGGKNKNRHWDKKVPKCQGRSWKDKTPVLIMEERGGNAIAQVVSDVKQKTLEPIIRKYVKEGSNVYTDEWHAYNDLSKQYNHETVNHRRKQYVKGKARVALIENFNSHLKRGIQGTYHWVSKKHLSGYVDEFIFRRNTRNYGEGERFDLVLSSTVGKQLTYQQLTNPY